MSLRNDQGGFIFSLDATLGMLIVMLVMAGVAQVARPGTIYEQYGYLRLTRHANDALEVMNSLGILRDVTDLVFQENESQAENIARKNLRNLLPDDVQFKLVVGDNDLIVYPTSDNEAWESAFNAQGEIAVATRLWVWTPENNLMGENVHILAWLDDPSDIAFMDDVDNDMPWEATRVENTDESFFRNEISRGGAAGNYYDVVFMPDAEQTFTVSTKDNLITFVEEGGRLVTGGQTLKNNDIGSGESVDNLLWQIHGVDNWGDPSGIQGDENAYRFMTIVATGHVITSTFEVGENVEYDSDNLEQYVYMSSSEAQVLAEHQSDPLGLVNYPVPWPAIVARDGPFTIDGRTIQGDGYLFNKRFAQNAEEKNKLDALNWFELIRNAIGRGANFRPITLYVWRGPEVA